MIDEEDNETFGEKLPLSISLSIVFGSIGVILLLVYTVYCIFKYRKNNSESENDVTFSGKRLNS